MTCPVQQWCPYPLACFVHQGCIVECREGGRMVEHSRALGESGQWADPGEAKPQAAFITGSLPRRFVLNRTEDPSGTSGVGVVAEGVAFTDGTVALRWIVALRSTAVYNSVDDLVAIHGHDGATTVVWADE